MKNIFIYIVKHQIRKKCAEVSVPQIQFQHIHNMQFIFFLYLCRVAASHP